MMACIIIAILGVDLIYVALVLIVWIGSLYLVTARPEEARPPRRPCLHPRQHGRPVRAFRNPRRHHRTRPGDHCQSVGPQVAGRTHRRAGRPHGVATARSDPPARPRRRWCRDRSRPGAAHGHLADQPQDARRTCRHRVRQPTAEADIARAHTDFVANASHELRTPLASIIGYVETLREDVESLDPTMADKFLGTIQREAKRLQDLVSDLMSLSRSKRKSTTCPNRRWNFRDLWNARRMMRPMATLRTARFRCRGRIHGPRRSPATGTAGPQPRR